MIPPFDPFVQLPVWYDLACRIAHNQQCGSGLTTFCVNMCGILSTAAQLEARFGVVYDLVLVVGLFGFLMLARIMVSRPDLPPEK